MKITETQLKQIIVEAAKKSLQEMRSGLCSKLMAIQGKFGDISQINLPEGSKIEDVKNEDIIKITKNPSPEENYNVKLSSGYYLIISPESETVKNGLAMSQQRNDLIAKRKELASKPVTRDEVIPTEDPEVTREKRRKEREIEKGFGSMKKVQDYIEEKYGQYLEFLTTRTRSGHDFVYQARISFISASYADGPSDVPQEVIDAVTKYLEPFGFYYAGVHGSSDEREFTSTGWYAWKRSGAVDPYERYMMRQAYRDSEMMYENKTNIKLTESQLKQIILEATKKSLKEIRSPRYDINGKRWNREYDKMSEPFKIDTDNMDSEKAAKEFLNRPNAAQDFKHFPRYSRWGGGEKDYNDLKNGSPKIQAFKKQREEEKKDREEMAYLKRIFEIAKKAVIPFTRKNVTDEEKGELEAMVDKWGWFEVREKWEEEFYYSWGHDNGEVRSVTPFWLYAAKVIYSRLKSDFEA